MNSVTHASKRCFWLGLLLLFTILILLAVLPVYASAYNVMLMCNILMYIIITVSWVLFSGPTGYISLASAAFFGVGIYTSAILGQILPLLAVVVVGAGKFYPGPFVGLITLRLRGCIFPFLLSDWLNWLSIFSCGGRSISPAHGAGLFLGWITLLYIISCL